jgi:hypothetical protein
MFQTLRSLKCRFKEGDGCSRLRMRCSRHFGHSSMRKSLDRCTPADHAQIKLSTHLIPSRTDNTMYVCAPACCLTGPTLRLCNSSFHVLIDGANERIRPDVQSRTHLSNISSRLLQQKAGHDGPGLQTPVSLSSTESAGSKLQVLPVTLMNDLLHCSSPAHAMGAAVSVQACPCCTASS